MVASLGQVEAPADFDFRLKARLASGEKVRNFSIHRFSLGVPAATVAALLLAVGALFLTTWRQATPQSPSAQQAMKTEEKTVTAPAPANAQPVGVLASAENPSKPNKREVRQTGRLIASQRRPSSKDFSSSPAPVMKQNESLAAVPAAFPIGNSPQSLKLSLDDGTGVYRTISVPRVSFGSQRAFGEQSAFVKTSSNGIW
jgi:hypothetical protein